MNLIIHLFKCGEKGSLSQLILAFCSTSVLFHGLFQWNWHSQVLMLLCWRKQQDEYGALQDYSVWSDFTKCNKKNWTTFHYSAEQLSQTQNQSKQKAFHGEEVGYSGQVIHMILIWLSCIPSENQSKWAKSDSERIFRENTSIRWSLWVKCLMKSLTEKQCSGNRFY